MQCKSLFRVFAMTAFLVQTEGIYAQEDGPNHLTVDLQMLFQGEVRDGGILNSDDYEEKEDVDDHSNFIIERSRLAINYQRDRLELKFTPQHQGIWGQSGKGSFNVYEAWAKYTTTAGFFGQIGRQTLSYDDERIIGPNDWAMAGISHDLLKVGYEGHGHKAHLLLAYNQNAENINGGTYYTGGAQPYKTMHTLWYHYDVPTFPLGVSLLFMNVGMQGGEEVSSACTQYQQLAGTYISYTPKLGSLTGSYYRQMGHDEFGMEIDAWMATVKATVRPADTYEIEAGFDYLSGDPYFAIPGKGMSGLTWHKKIQGFNSIYGSHHKFYGAMDFFYVSTYYNGFSPGLQNAYIGATAWPHKKLSLSASYHYMATSTSLRNVNMTLGHAIELGVAYSFKPNIRISGGFSYMTGTETMEKLKRASSDGSLRWAWLTLSVSPRIINMNW